MATLLADPPARNPTEQPPAPVPEPAAVPHAGTAPAMLWRNCANCGSQMHVSQDWCLQCGAGAPDSLLASTPRWRSGAAVLGVVAILVIGAAVAAYAALNRSQAKARPLTTALVRVPPPAATVPPPTGTTTSTTSPATTPKIGATGSTKAALPLGLAKPPKIPLIAATPKTPATTTPASTTPAATVPNEHHAGDHA